MALMPERGGSVIWIPAVARGCQKLINSKL
jgi:hypothetical protein